jgi:hypothetical protein
MTTIERTTERMVVRSGPTTLTLDKGAAALSMTRKALFWTKKPKERPLSDIVGVNVDRSVDRASGVELCCVALIVRDGSAWSLPYTTNEDAANTAAAMRDFLGISQA